MIRIIYKVTADEKWQICSAPPSRNRADDDDERELKYRANLREDNEANAMLQKSSRNGLINGNGACAFRSGLIRKKLNAEFIYIIDFFL